MNQQRICWLRCKQTEIKYQRTWDDEDEKDEDELESSWINQQHHFVSIEYKRYTKFNIIFSLSILSTD